MTARQGAMEFHEKAPTLRYSTQDSAQTWVDSRCSDPFPAAELIETVLYQFIVVRGNYARPRRGYKALQAAVHLTLLSYSRLMEYLKAEMAAQRVIYLRGIQNIPEDCCSQGKVPAFNRESTGSHRFGTR
jgi:hypothetical protein